MNIEVPVKMIVTKDSGEQIVINDVSSVSVLIDVMGQRYMKFMTNEELIRLVK
jgi:hypothetical protein